MVNGPVSAKAPDVLAWAIDELAAADIPWAVGDGEILVANALGLRRTNIQAGEADGVELTDAQLAQVQDHVERRKAREPIQLLTGKAFFRSMEMVVGPGAYIPRRETEYTAQLAIDALLATGLEHPIAVDIGAGVGAIALAIANEVPGSEVYAVEIEESTYEWMVKNFELFGTPTATPVLGDALTELGELDGRVDVVAGNAPWMPDGVDSPTPEVALWSGQGQSEAFLHGGGSDGMDFLRAFSKRALALLKPGGVWVEEHGISQAPTIRALFEADGWLDIESHIDPMGRERVTTARRP